MVHKSTINTGGGGGGSGTVTQINTGTGLTGGPITSSGTVSVATNTANTLAGFDNSGTFSDVAVGTGLALSGGTLTSTNAGTVTAVSIATANGFSGSSSGGATPALTIVAGAITPTSVNKMTITPPATSSTLVVADGKTFTSSNTLTLTGTDSTSFAFPSSSDTVSTIAATQTFTNKRVSQRITTIVSSATPAINTDNCDAVTITAQAANITSFTSSLTGTPLNFDKIIIRIKDNGAGPYTIVWGASFAAAGVALPTTTVTSKVLTVGFIWDSVASTWGCVASAQS